LKRISVLGSTGSIGSQTLDIARSHPEDFSVVALAAGASKLESLAEQIEQFAPKLVSVPDAVAAGKLREMLGGKRKVELVYGKEGLEQVAAHPDVDMVVSGVVGAMGILPTAAAARAGKTIALASCRCAGSTARRWFPSIASTLRYSNRCPGTNRKISSKFS
jgi:1-deoxy-D-xylulose-5-phosphate reductoisomerase